MVVLYLNPCYHVIIKCVIKGLHCSGVDSLQANIGNLIMLRLILI